ncbi:protein PELOTA 1-like [Nicotiana tomentosiformis]|uniref:protein PELOTA 1-like n=1 Tax=Nicotiana tomentosiformis TaxID=4098 RepID=UPI00051B5D65|nr:protein PELOTA 1-like [Nicotiana tomentosiformis]
MKLLGQKLVPNQPGTTTIIPEQPDDLWFLYNLIANGDIISAPTTRKIQTCSDKKNTSRVKLELEIRITSFDYDKSCSIIRVRGKTITPNDHVKSGVFHTLELGKNKEFNLMKKLWDEETIGILKDGSDPNGGSKVDLAVILMKEGLAQIFLIRQSATSHCATIQGDKITNNSGSKSFFENIFVSFRKHIDMDVIPYVVIASCESIKDEFRVYLLLEAHRSKIKSIENNKSRILLVNKNNEKEILHDKVVMSMMKNTKSEIDIKVLDEFMNMVSTNSKRACYGTKDVEYAHELMAIETLLITKEILRNEDNKMRQKYLRMEKSVKKAGGKVVQFNQDIGQRLAQLTGIAAILRFPLPDVDELVL